MPEQLLRVFESQMSRRRALVRFGAGTVVVMASMIGLGTKANAVYSFMCCTLCLDPHGQSNAGCVCAWCWACCNDLSNRFVTYCCECKMDTGETCPTSACSGVDKSYVYQDGLTC